MRFPSAVRRALRLPEQVRRIVGRFASMNPWIGYDDLAQEAAVALLTASPSWVQRNPAMVVRRQLWLHVMQRKSPVGARTGKNNVPTGATACELKEHHHPATDGVEWHMDAEKAASLVREALDAHSEAARRVLLGEEQPAVVAKELGLRIGVVYRETKLAREALMRDRRLKRIAQDLYA